ncbi:MAG: FAD-dependent oxidoreductase, partial [Anaerolineaceae bacterium]
NAALGIDRHYIGGTKGSHIVLDHPELCQAIGENEFFFENKDGRIVLIFPFHGRIIVGTTDIPVENADQVRCTDEEIDYFIDLVSHVFPDIRLGREQIVFRFAGVRPLEYSTAKTTGQISRDHSIHEDSFSNIPVYSLVGGKWTSYRAFSEQVTDKALGFLGLQRTRDTKKLAIGGGQDYPTDQEAQTRLIETIARQGKLEESHARKLFERYGTRVLTIAGYLAAAPDQLLKSHPDWTRREVEFIAEHEKVIHLDDILLRRSTLAWLGEASLQLVQELTGILAQSLGWDSAQEKVELQRTLEKLKEEHGVVL